LAILNKLPNHKHFAQGILFVMNALGTMCTVLSMVIKIMHFQR